MMATASSLPFGTRLKEFELTGVLGEGGFSVVYVALDHSLERTVAIKEYMPNGIAARQSDGTVLPKSPQREDTFQAGLASFINEARLLARFNHPALIHIHRVWEQNGTAYMAMQYCVGKTLRQISQTDPAVVKNEGWLKATFTPILDALELLHAHNCFHRDISPDNILLLSNGAPILLDFGAARQVIGDMTQALTVILKPGFAPIEQYADDANLQQGAWTDVYGVGAVLYFLLVGKPPVASVARLVRDPMPKLVDANDFDWVSPSFRDAIDRALAVHPDQRIRSIAELRNALQLPTFKPEFRFGEMFPTPSTVVPTAVSDEKQLPAASRGDPLTENKTERGLLPVPELSSQKATQADVLSAPADAHPQPGKAWFPKHPWILLVGIIGVTALLALVAAIVVLSSSADDPDSLKNTATGESKEPLSLAVPASAQEPSYPVLPASTTQDVQSKTPEASSSGATTATQATVDSAQVPTTVPPPGAKTQGDMRPIIDPEKSSAQPAQDHSGHDGLTPSTPIPPKLPSSSSGGSTDQTLPTHPVNNQPAEDSRPHPEQPASRPQALSTVRFSIRPWGNISIDGQEKGSSPPLTRVQLPPGNHTVVITNGNFPPVTKQVEVPDKGDVIVTHRFGDG